MGNNLNEQIDTFIDYQLSLTVKEKDIERLNALRQIALNRQFVDAPEGLSKSEYNSWLVKEAKKSFILTLEAPSILMGSWYHYPKHSEEELETKTNIGNLTPNQIIEILNSINIYTIMKLICSDVEIFNAPRRPWGYQYGYIGINGYFSSDGNSFYLESYPFREYNKKETIKSISNKNAYEYLYRGLCLPIKTILGSINEVNTHIKCDLDINPDLCETIYQIQSKQPIEVIENKRLIKGNRRYV